MNKSMLIIDTPASCDRCRLPSCDNEGYMICAGELLPPFEINASIDDYYWYGDKPE